MKTWTDGKSRKMVVFNNVHTTFTCPDCQVWLQDLIEEPMPPTGPFTARFNLSCAITRIPTDILGVLNPYGSVHVDTSQGGIYGHYVYILKSAAPDAPKHMVCGIPTSGKVIELGMDFMVGRKFEFDGATGKWALH